MKRTFLVLLYTLGITVICYPCRAEPTPIGYDYLGEDKLERLPEPKRKPNANVFRSRLGRNWFQQNSGFTLTNEQQRYTPKNKVFLPNSRGPDLYETSEGLTLPNLLSEHNLYAHTKELSIYKSLKEPDWYEPSKVVISKGQYQNANKNKLFLSNRLHGFDLYVQASSYHMHNEQKKELSWPSPNGQDSYKTDLGLILSGGQQNEPDTRLNGGISSSNEPNEQIQYANKEKLSLPKAVGHIWYIPNVDMYLAKRLEENRQWDKPKIEATSPILTKKIKYDVYETLNLQNLRKQDEYIVKVVMRRQKGIQIYKVKDDIMFTFTMPKSRLRPKQRTNDKSTAYFHGRQNFQKISSGRDKNKIYDKNQKRFKIEHNRKDSHKKGGKDSHKKGVKDSQKKGGKNSQNQGKGKGKSGKFDKNQKRFKIVNGRLNQYQNQLYMQYVSNFQNNHDNFQNNHDNFQNNHGNFQYNHDNFQNNHDNFQNNFNSENHGHQHDRHNIVDGQSYMGRKPEPLVNKPKVFLEENGDGPIPEILVRRPDNYWYDFNMRPKHYFK